MERNPAFPFVVGTKFLPHIAEMILGGSGAYHSLLDDDDGDFERSLQTLLKAREVCKDWKAFVDRNTWLWRTLNSGMYHVCSLTLFIFYLLTFISFF